MPDEIMAVVMMGIGAFTFIVIASIVAGVIQSVTKTREKERTRREIAAYVAEGSMTPEEGARLIDAGRPAWQKELWNRQKS